jgi:hypothetical protein
MAIESYHSAENERGDAIDQRPALPCMLPQHFFFGLSTCGDQRAITKKLERAALISSQLWN